MGSKLDKQGKLVPERRKRSSLLGESRVDKTQFSKAMKETLDKHETEADMMKAATAAHAAKESGAAKAVAESGAGSADDSQASRIRQVPKPFRGASPFRNP